MSKKPTRIAAAFLLILSHRVAVSAQEEILPPEAGKALEDCTRQLQAVKRSMDEDGRKATEDRIAAHERYRKAVTALFDTAIKKNQLEEANQLAAAEAWAEYQLDQLDHGARQRLRTTRELDRGIAATDAKLAKAMDDGNLEAANKCSEELKQLKAKRAEADKAALPTPPAASPATAKAAQKTLEADLRAVETAAAKKQETRTGARKEALMSLLKVMDKINADDWELYVAAELDKQDGEGRVAMRRTVALRMEMQRKEEEKREAMKARDLTKANEIQKEIEAIGDRIKGVTADGVKAPAGLGSAVGVAWAKVVEGTGGVAIRASKPREERMAGKLESKQSLDVVLVAGGGRFTLTVHSDGSAEYLDNTFEGSTLHMTGKWLQLQDGRIKIEWDDSRFKAGGWRVDGYEINKGPNGCYFVQSFKDGKPGGGAPERWEKKEVPMKDDGADGKAGGNTGATMKTLAGAWSLQYEGKPNFEAWRLNEDGSLNAANGRVQFSGTWKIDGETIHLYTGGCHLVCNASDLKHMTGVNDTTKFRMWRE